MTEDKEKTEKTVQDFIDQCADLRSQNEELQAEVVASQFVGDLAASSELNATIAG